MPLQRRFVSSVLSGLVGVRRPLAEGGGSPVLETGEVRVRDGVRSSDSGFGGANLRILSLRARDFPPPPASSSKWIVNAMELDPDACVSDAGVAGLVPSSMDLLAVETTGDDSWELFPPGFSICGGGGARSLLLEYSGLQVSVVGLVGGGRPAGNTSLTVLTESSVLLKSSRESASCMTGEETAFSWPALCGELGEDF